MPNFNNHPKAKNVLKQWLKRVLTSSLLILICTGLFFNYIGSIPVESAIILTTPETCSVCQPLTI